MKQVLSGLMAQLEAVAKEESVVVGRKKGQDSDRDLMSAQLERLQKEKKEVEKLNEKAQLELERLRKNRDNEIKKLKKKMEETQKAMGKKGDGKAMEKLRNDIRELDTQLLDLRGELEKKKDAEKRDQEVISHLKTQLADVTKNIDELRATNGAVSDNIFNSLFNYFSLFSFSSISFDPI
jgi:predicted  nucleic acid-binding Zn-ribbon protein